MTDVNLIPKEYKEKKKGIGAIFSKTGGVVLVLLILALLFYGGLLFYQNNLNQELDNIKAEVENLDQQRDKEKEDEIIDLDKKLAVLEDLFEEHFYWSGLFNKIEELIIPEAYFTNSQLRFSIELINVTFTGNTLSYTSLARQMKSLQDDSQVKKVEVSDISLSPDGGIDFDLEVIFSKDILLSYD